MTLNLCILAVLGCMQLPLFPGPFADVFCGCGVSSMQAAVLGGLGVASLRVAMHRCACCLLAMVAAGGLPV